MNTDRLEELSFALIDNKQEILQNRNYLKNLTTETTKILDQITRLGKQNKKGTIEIRLDVAGLKLELFEIGTEVKKQVKKVDITTQDTNLRVKNLERIVLSLTKKLEITEVHKEEQK